MPSVIAEDCPPVVYVRQSPRDFPHIRVKREHGRWVHVGKRPWRMALVKPNADRAFARECLAHNIIYFLPMKPCTVLKAGRKVKGMRVLFPGYVFFKADGIEYYEVKRFRKHFQLVDLDDQIGVQRQLEKLFRSLEWCLGKMEEQFPLGQPVSIIAGHLEGLTARVIAHEDDGIVRCAVRMVFGDAIFRLPADNLALVPGPAKP